MSTARRRTDLHRARLKVGAWYSIKYGFDRMNVCVIDMTDNKVRFENPRWCLSSSEWMLKDVFFSGWHNPIFLGYGRPRPIVGWLRRKLDCWGTLYTRPERWRGENQKDDEPT